MATWNSQIIARLIECVSRNQFGQLVFLVLALAPSAIVAAIAVDIWLSGDAATYGWHSKIWPVVILQVLSIAAFLMHANSNKKLANGELGEWVLQMIIYIPFGMISYWKQHVWGKGQ